jgi:hypothetical protein
VNEYPVFVPLGEERIAGVLTVPDSEVLGLWVLMAGQGAPRGTQYHFPIWTEVARRLAEHGLASIRMDHLAVGDSTGRSEELVPYEGREQEPIAVARFGIEATGASVVGFAGNCYGGRLAVETAMLMPSCVGVVAAHTGPPIERGEIPAFRRLRHRIRTWTPVARVFETGFGRRVLEPIVSALSGRSREFAAGSSLDDGLRRLLARARVVFVMGDDEARYHLRLRPFLDRFLPTLSPALSGRIESILVPVRDVGGYMALEGQLRVLEVVVDRAVRFTLEGRDPSREADPVGGGPAHPA